MKPVHANSWKQEEIQISNKLNEWKYPEAARDMNDSPVTLFEIFSLKYSLQMKSAILSARKQIHTLLKKEIIH